MAELGGVEWADKTVPRGQRYTLKVTLTQLDEDETETTLADPGTLVYVVSRRAGSTPLLTLTEPVITHATVDGAEVATIPVTSEENEDFPDQRLYHELYQHASGGAVRDRLGYGALIMTPAAVEDHE